MAQYDPALRVETWVFFEIGKIGRKPVYKRAGFNYVSYDGDPERMIEPVNKDGQVLSSAPSGTYSHQMLRPTQHFGQVGNFEILRGRPSEVHNFSDLYVDVS